MRKGIRLIGILSAAALISAGASMTAYAEGWTEENGYVVYLDDNNGRVTNTWMMRYNEWLWLDGDGMIAKNQLVEVGGDCYGVDQNGYRITADWLGISDDDDAGEDLLSKRWYYFRGDGKSPTGNEPATNQWMYLKGTNEWYWLDGDGMIAREQLIEFDGDYYYLGREGLVVTNNWIKVDNTDDSDEDAPGFYFYYFQNSGKAMKGNESGKTTLKTINKIKYAFDGEGRMLTGWVDQYSTRHTDDDAWRYCDYYFVEEAGNMGMATQGWAQIKVIDETREWDRADVESEDQNYWFYFTSTGKKLKAPENSETLKYKTINGQKYGFEDTGRMVFEWTPTLRTVGTASTATGSAATAGSPARLSAVENFGYFNDRDDGARVSKGWFKVLPDIAIDYDGYNGDEDQWYYAYGSGKICHSEFRNINGRQYAFDNSGKMLTGLQAIYTDSAGRIWNRELEDEELMDDATLLTHGGTTAMRLINEDGQVDEDEITVREAYENVAAGEDGYGGEGEKKKPTYGVYYFGQSGGASTGVTTVKFGDVSYTFCFQKAGAQKGVGLNGKVDKYLYQNGRRLKADEAMECEAYFIAADPWEENGQLISVVDDRYQEQYGAYSQNQDTFFLPGHAYAVDSQQVNMLASALEHGSTQTEGNKIYLINAKGNTYKGTKRDIKDGDDNYYQIKNGSVTTYYISKDENGNPILAGNGMVIPD